MPSNKDGILSGSQQAKLILTSKKIFQIADDLLLGYGNKRNSTIDSILLNPNLFLDTIIDKLKQGEDSTIVKQLVQNPNIVSLRDSIDFNNSMATLDKFSLHISPSIKIQINELSNRLKKDLLKDFAQYQQDSIEVRFVSEAMNKVIRKYEDDIANDNTLTPNEKEILFTITTILGANAEDFIGFSISMVEYISYNNVFGRAWRGIRNAIRFVANAIVTVVNVAVSAIITGMTFGIIAGAFGSVLGPLGFAKGFIVGMLMGAVVATYEAISRNRCVTINGYTPCSS